MLALTKITSLGGVPVNYDREPASLYGSRGIAWQFAAAPTFVARLDACFSELWAVSGWGRAVVITSGGAYVSKPGNHGRGRAFDLDGIFWRRRSLVTQRDGAEGANRLLYYGVECVLRRHFGQVLDFQHDPRHHDHLHVDDSAPVAFCQESRSATVFVQGVLSEVYGHSCACTGEWDKATADGVCRVLDQFNISGEIEQAQTWRNFLRLTAVLGFRPRSGESCELQLRDAWHASPRQWQGPTTKLPIARTWRQVVGAWQRAEELAFVDPTETAFMARQRDPSHHSTDSRVGRWCNLEQISPFVACALVHGEDPGFFRHRGFWWTQLLVEIARAFGTGQPVRGVSTITQQLARNLFLYPGRTLARKLREAILTVRLEQVLTKLRILEVYLNVIEWGVGIWGIEAAACHYFGTAASDLSAYQAIVLASLVPAPTRPLSGANAVRVLTSQVRLASLLYGSGMIGRTEELAINGRIESLGRTLHLRGSLELESIRQLAEAVDAEPAVRRLTVDGALADECGASRRLSYEAFLRENPHLARAMQSWPEWWSPRHSGAPPRSEPLKPETQSASAGQGSRVGVTEGTQEAFPTLTNTRLEPSSGATYSLDP